MDSEVMRDGRLLDIVDDEWRWDRLPHDDITVPQVELPDVDIDNSMETIKEQEQKWADLALQNLNETPSSNQGN